MCETPDMGKGTSKIGYIKLTSFIQNASGKISYKYLLFFTILTFFNLLEENTNYCFSAAVKEAIETLRRDNVDAFVLDLHNNR